MFGAGNKNAERWHAKALLINPHKTKIAFTQSPTNQRGCHIPPWIYRRLPSEQPDEEIGEGIHAPVDPSMEVTCHFPADANVAELHSYGDDEI